MIKKIRIFSVLGAFLVGFWIPVRLIGFVPHLAVEIVFDLLISMVAGANIWLHFQLHEGSWKSLRSWKAPGLLADTVCLLPLALIGLWLLPDSLGAVLFFNLLLVRHVTQIRPLLESIPGLTPLTFRILPIFIFMPLLVHLISCGWIGLGSGTAAASHEDPFLTYTKAFYWAMTTLTTVGYGDISAKTILQMYYASGVQVMGVGVFGFLISNVASMLSRSDAAREHHLDNLDRVETFMQTHKIPQHLRLKTRAYFNFLWVQKKGYRDHNLLEELPGKLQSELYFFINQSIVNKVPFLRDASDELLEKLMSRLEPRILVPGERIFRADDIGDGLYLIQNGNVEIRTKSGEPVAHLGEGSFFGEMALVSDQPRSASAFAADYCDLYFLPKGAFDTVMQEHSDFAAHVHEVVRARKLAG